MSSVCLLHPDEEQQQQWNRCGCTIVALLRSAVVVVVVVGGDIAAITRRFARCSPGLGSTAPSNLPARLIHGAATVSTRHWRERGRGQRRGQRQRRRVRNPGPERFLRSKMPCLGFGQSTTRTVGDCRWRIAGRIRRRSPRPRRNR